MNQQKVEENVAKFLAQGFTRAREPVNGFPVVYKKIEIQNHIVCREIYLVDEEISPDSLPETLPSFPRLVSETE